ncbi:MAG TPA: ribbon-helix-helix protein, CopG family [bacterium]|nr:ribbon-helix-helix protein, CopG family [bacterium]
MKQSNVSFRTDASKLASLDAIAEALERDRSYVLNEAVSAYLELYDWQLRHIKEGVRQANAGEFASDKAVAKVLRRRSR